MNGFGNVEYREFLRRFSQMERPCTAAPSESVSVSSVGLNVPELGEPELESIPENEELAIAGSDSEAGTGLSQSMPAHRPATSLATRLPPIGHESLTVRQGFAPAGEELPERPQSQMACVERIERRVLGLSRATLKRLLKCCRMKDLHNLGTVPAKDFFGELFTFFYKYPHFDFYFYLDFDF